LPNETDRRAPISEISCAAVAARGSATRNEPKEIRMATRFMYKALVTAALGIALSLSLAATTTASPASSNTEGAIQLDLPAAPSNCRSRTHFERITNTTTISVTWRDNSTNEDGFTIEAWCQNESAEWVLAGSRYMAADSTLTSFGFYGRNRPNYRFRVKAFNTSGDSAWSNWSH
jgi:hypothetical protein